jgi:hypothetical protein
LQDWNTKYAKKINAKSAKESKRRGEKSVSVIPCFNR